MFEREWGWSRSGLRGQTFPPLWTGGERTEADRAGMADKGAEKGVHMVSGGDEVRGGRRYTNRGSCGDNRYLGRLDLHVVTEGSWVRAMVGPLLIVSWQ